jgi:hypothetical protein
LYQYVEAPTDVLAGGAGGGGAGGASAVVGLYKLIPADPQLESAWFQPLNLRSLSTLEPEM